jgi:hypothetical protein
VNTFNSLTKAYAYFSMLLYLSLTYLKVLIKKAMGCSLFSSFVYNNTIAMVLSKEKEKIRNSVSENLD